MVLCDPTAGRHIGSFKAFHATPAPNNHGASPTYPLRVDSTRDKGAIMRNHVTPGIALLLLATWTGPVQGAPPATKRAAPQASPPHRFDAGTQKTVAGLLDQLEKDLGALIRNRASARKNLLAQAYAPQQLSPRLDAFRAAANRIKASRVKLNGIEVRATLWHHRVPLQDVELYFWRTSPTSFEVLRLMSQRTFHTFFGGPEIVTYRSEAGIAAVSLAKEITTLIATQRCGAVPTVQPKYLEPFLPKETKARKQTLFQFHKFRHRTVSQCRSVRHLAFNRVTFRIGDVGGVVLDPAGERYSFKLMLAGRDDAERSLAIANIIDPVPPSRHQPRGALLKFKTRPKKTPQKP